MMSLNCLFRVNISEKNLGKVGAISLLFFSFIILHLY